LRLPPRLDGLLRLAPEVRAAADIGSGHGLLARALATRGVRVVATEHGSRAMAVLRADLSGAAGTVDVREGDGLAALVPGEVELAVIAGMGGRTITAILDRAGWLPRWLLLQPVQDSAVVEVWVEATGWPVRQAPLSQHGRWYQAWLVEVPVASRRLAA
jgi:tRNA (adenine22-N1)-methyltransferase